MIAVVTGTHRFPDPLLARSVAVTLDGGSRPVAAHRCGDVLLVNRHGPAERTPVHLVDHATNVRAVATQCDAVVAVGSCSSLRTDLPAGSIVALDDVFAPWIGPTLFDDARAESLPGFDAEWRAEVVAAWRTSATAPLVDGGTYVQSRGPRFETKAEVRFFATVGDVVGMTLASEMIVAREAGLRYAAICAVGNLANGVGDQELTLAETEATARGNRERLWAAVVATLAGLGAVL